MPLRASIPLLVVLLAGCARGAEFPDKTAEVRVGGDLRTYALDSCGLDGQTLFVVGRADDGSIVQGVVGLEDDDETGVPASTGLTVDLDPTTEESRVAAFGEEAWERRGSSGLAPGEITSAKLRGSRIQFAGTAEPVDAQDRPVGGAPVAFSVDARCDLEE